MYYLAKATTEATLFRWLAWGLLLDGSGDGAARGEGSAMHGTLLMGSVVARTGEVPVVTAGG